MVPSGCWISVPRLHFRQQERNMALGNIRVPAMSFRQEPISFLEAPLHWPPLISYQLEESHMAIPRRKGVLGGEYLTLHRVTELCK